MESRLLPLSQDVRGAAECYASFVREYYAWCYRYNNTRVSTG